MQNISTAGHPAPLTLVPQAVFETLSAAAARDGIVTLPDGRHLNSAQYLECLMAAPEAVSAGAKLQVYLASGAAAGAIASTAFAMMVPGLNVAIVAAALSGKAVPALAGKIGVTLIIANGLQGALRQTDYLLVHGNQTGFPALVDPQDIQPPRNLCVIDGFSAIQTGDEPLSLYGVGCYRFEKDHSIAGMGIFGASGAMSFVSDDPATGGKTMAVAWHFPDKLERSKPGYGVTADLTANYKSLQAFYDAAAGAGSIAHRQASTPEWRIDLIATLRDADSASTTAADQGEHVLTLAVQPGRRERAD